MRKIFYWFILCFRAFRSFLSNKKKSEKNGNCLVGGYPPPPLFGKRPNYFRFFLVKTSLRIYGGKCAKCSICSHLKQGGQIDLPSSTDYHMAIFCRKNIYNICCRKAKILVVSIGDWAENQAFVDPVVRISIATDSNGFSMSLKNKHILLKKNYFRMKIHIGNFQYVFNLQKCKTELFLVISHTFRCIFFLQNSKYWY